MKLNFLTATELKEKILKNETSVTEVCRDCFDRIDSIEHKVKAWEYLDKESVFLAAGILDKKRQKGLLAGIPVGIKDIFNTKDMPTAMGSPIWRGFNPGNDARTVHNIRVNDGIVFGKTVTAEFAVHHLPKGKTVNPHNYKHTPGTSSSGSAASVAACMVPVALGTQTAGSIIRPASYCGIYGFKPTFGTVPRTGMLKTTDTLDSVGCFARSIEDIKLIFDLIRVKGPDYPFVNENLAGYKRFPEKIRIGFIDDGISVFKGFEQYALGAFRTYIQRLAKNKQVAIKKIKPQALFNEIHQIHAIIYDKTLSYYFKDEFKQRTLISKIMYEIIGRGNRITALQYRDALERQAYIRKKISDGLNEYDVVLTLSTAGEAPPVEAEEKPDTCLIWTFLGYPVLGIPKFTGPGNLPFGLQAVAKKYDDYKLLSIANKILAKINT